LCLLLSFLLSGMEAGVFALNRLRLRRMARTGNVPAQVLNRFLEKPEEFLWTILIGNTLVNFSFLGWLLARLHATFTGETILIVVIFITVLFLFYAFFDLLPKMLFRSYPNRLCLRTARIFRIVSLLDGRPRVHGPALRRPRGIARGDGRGGAGAHRRGTRDGEPRAGLATFQSRADRRAAGKNHRHRGAKNNS
jgi:hypothetical protein